MILGAYIYVRVGDNAELTWKDIQERIDWCLDHHLTFQRNTYANQFWLAGTYYGFIVDFIFEKPNDAMLFKLRWGGE